MKHRQHKHGSVLIVVLGVLMLLALLGTALSTRSMVERRITRNYTDGVRAKVLAQSGVEYALERLQNVNFLKDDAWFYKGSGALEQATAPSFQSKDAAGQPAIMTIDGKPLGISGEHSGGSYSQHGEVYSLKVTGCNSLLNVNDGKEFGSAHSVSRNLRRMLEILGKIRGVPQTLMDKIVDDRPSQGYHSKFEVLARMGYNHPMFDKIKDFITVHAWVDTKVAEPVPLSAEALGAYPQDIKYFRGSPAVYRWGRQKNAMGAVINDPLLFYPLANPTDDRIKAYGVDELNPQWIEVTSRAPIEVNSASREILTVALSGLQGFFRVERRQNNPSIAFVHPMVLGHLGQPPAVPWTGNKQDYAPADSAGGSNRDDDDIGLLYATEPIQEPKTGDTTTTSSGVQATTLADEIVACRERKTGPSGYAYASSPFGGPFRTWAQFNKFCDNLVKVGLLKDSRNIYFDVFSGMRTPSMAQHKLASQALADVLKANFNPNLHLNELNPDANLALLVDKTDLIVHSTEFCLYPPGTFEIESLGRVLRSVGNGTTTAPKYETIAEAKVATVVKLWESYRDTTQKDLYAGEYKASTFQGPAKKVETNSGYALEIGPEPNNGLKPDECEYDGYLALASTGGVGVDVPKGQFKTTPAGHSELGEWLHAHFQFDFDAHYHQFGDQFRKEANRNVLPEETATNHPDKLTNVPGPYDPVWDGQGVHRCCRSFRLGNLTSTTMFNLQPYAPSDLRIDGGYSERNSAPGYVVMNGLVLKRTLEVTTKSVPTISPG